MADLIDGNGRAKLVQPSNRNHGFTLDELYKLLDCETVEVVNLHDGRLMVIDEEGKFKENHFVNPKATRMLHLAGGMPDDYIAGLALICSQEEFQ